MSADPKTNPVIPTPLQRHRIIARLCRREKDRQAAIHRDVLDKCIEQLRTDPSDPTDFRCDSKEALVFVAGQLRDTGYQVAGPYGNVDTHLFIRIYTGYPDKFFRT